MKACTTGLDLQVHVYICELFFQKPASRWDRASLMHADTRRQCIGGGIQDKRACKRQEEEGLPQAMHMQ